MSKSGAVGGGSKPSRFLLSSVRGAAAASRRPTSASMSAMAPSDAAGQTAKQMRLGGRVAKDPRPSDEAYHDRCIRELAEFLTQNNYPHPVSLQQLKQPSLNDFRSIFEFLVGFQEPGFKLGEKLEEEIPPLLKLYGYPFPVPKSHFQMIAQHSWPTLLKVLTWLRIEYQAVAPDEVERAFLPKDGDGIVGWKKMLWDYTNETYDMHLKGCDSFDDVLANLEKKHDLQITEEIESLTEERNKNRKIYDELTAQPDELKKMKKHLESLNMESEKFEKYQGTMEAHVKELSTHLQRLTQEETEQIAKLKESEAEQQIRMGVLTSRKEAGVNFPHLMNKLKSARRRITVIEEENEALGVEIQRNEEKNLQDKEQVQLLVRKYNRIRRELMPDRDDLDMTGEVTEDGQRHNEDVNLQRNKLQAELNEDLERLDVELSKERSQAEFWQNELQARKEIKAQVLCNTMQLRKQLHDGKEAHVCKMKEYKGYIEALEGRRVVTLADVEQSEKCLKEETLDLQACERYFQLEEEAYAKSLQELRVSTAESRKEIQATIDESERDIKKHLDKLDPATK